VDLTESMLRMAQQKALPALDSVFLGDAERLPFGQGSFDVVLSCYVVKYCSAPLLASEAHRVLRPGGRLILYDFSRPRGAYAPLLAFYVHGVLRAIGLVMRLTGSSAAFTYEALPSVIQERRWDDDLGGVLTSAGFREIGVKRLSGGAATGFSAIRS
jgi:demethylmenaquinone methyltransferase / 2-methoxy-6-polyprenyl-1,4-benzoquinol methylase